MICAQCSFAYDHANCAQYVPVYLIAKLNLSDTHRICKELLELNGSSYVTIIGSLPEKCFDITIKQTINLCAQSQGDIIGISG